MRRAPALAAVTAAALLAAGTAPAHASGSLSVCMEINIGKHRCSLGFFGFNANHDRLAVSAGHCADDVDQAVYSSNGTEIGTVVSHKPDSDSLDGIRPRGYTLILTYREFSIEPFFTGIADAHTGDSVTKFGARSGKTTGRITKTHYTDGKDPTNETLFADVVILPGDSGCPWYSSGPTLVGISASGHYESGGGDDQGSQAQPVWSVIHLIRQESPKWGPGFKVWTEG